MSTAQMTEIEPMDSAFWDDYKAPQATTTSLPPEGKYFLQLPQVIEDEAFQVYTDKQSGKPYLSITLGTKSYPVVIAEGDFQGKELRYLRVDTRLIAKLVKNGESWVAQGYENASNAADLILNFGTGDRPSSVEEWKQAIQRLGGMVTPSPVYLTWEGKDKLATNNKAKYLRSKDFPTTTNSDGSKTRPSVLQRVNPATGEFYPVYANLAIGRRGFSPR